MSIGTLYIIAAPSGTGKTSLVAALVQQVEKLEVSISYTTRPKREVEHPGRSYHFIDQAEFATLVKQDVFMEHATVFGHAYGTPRQAVIDKLNAGIDVILEIDWQGAHQVKSQFPECVSIFILPPSKQTLLSRLQSRGQDEAAVIERRLSEMKDEVSKCSEFDYWVVNDDFERAVSDLCAILRARRLLSARKDSEHAHLIHELLANSD